jgi:hypothetical protein
MHPLRFLLILTGLYVLLLLCLIALVPVQGAAIPLALGREEMVVNVWRPETSMLITVWYQNAASSMHLLTLNVPLLPITLGIAFIVLAALWWPSSRLSYFALDTQR